MNVFSYDPAQQVYDQLWAEAMTSFAQDEGQTDPYL